MFWMYVLLVELTPLSQFRKGAARRASWLARLAAIVMMFLGGSTSESA